MSELYELPDGWEWKKIGDLCDSTQGIQIPKSEQISEFKSGYIRYLYINDFTTERNLIYVKDKYHNKIVNIDEYVIANTGAAGHIYISKNVGVLSNNLFKVHNFKDLNGKYFYYNYLHLYEVVLQNILKQSTQPHLGHKIFKNLDIPLPPFPEQQRIVSKLDLLFEKIDKSIALHQKNINEVNAFMGSVLNDVFGELSTDKTISLKNITKKIGSGSTPRGGQKAYKIEGVSLIRSMNVHDNGFRLKGLAFIDDEQAKKLDNVAIVENDVLLNITGASVARCCIVDKNYLPARVNQHVSILRLKNGMIPSFLHYYLISPSVKSELLLSSSGGATREAITKSMLEEFQVPFVSVPTQQKTVKYLDEISQKLEKIKQLQKEKMASLKALKASILDSAFRGEL